jgi:hypothetical protein
MGMSYPLILDKEFASSLDIEKSSLITLIFSESNRLQNLQYQASDLSQLREFTKRYASQLKEIPVCGIIGLSAFDNTAVSLDIQEGNLEYGDVPSTGDGWQSINWIQTESGYRIAISPASDYTLQSGVTTGSYETWIDSVCASIAGFPGGDFERCQIGSINLMNYTAVRPLESETAGRPDAMIGNSFWQNFQVVFDPAGKKIWLRDKHQKISDFKEQIYYKALINKDSNAIEAYIDANPSSRLAEEAIETLIEQRLDDSALNKDAIGRAGERLVRALPPKDAAEKLIGYADQLFEQQRYEADVIPLLLEHARLCCLKNADASIMGYEAQGRLGRYAILKKDWSQARLHLLSALFGQPTNPKFNYWMGQYYEANGQLPRAWSRYLKASLGENASPEAIAAIGQLNNNPIFREQFSMQDAQEYLEDYIPAYNPAELPEGLKNPAIKLIETFTNTDDAASAQVELALKAIDDANGLVVMNYHLGKPNPEPFENAASLIAAERYKTENSPALAINGGMIDSNQLQSQDPKNTLIAIAASNPANIPVIFTDITAEAKQDGIWTITIPAQNLSSKGFCEVYLVERQCMLLSSTGIGMYHNVVRACLFNQQVKPPSKAIVITMDINQIQSDIAKYADAVQTAHNIKFNTVPTYIDARISYLVAKVYGADGQLIAIGKQNLNQIQDGNNVR